MDLVALFIGILLIAGAVLLVFSFWDQIERVIRAVWAVQSAHLDPAAGLRHADDLVPSFERLIFLIRAVDIQRRLRFHTADRRVNDMVQEHFETAMKLSETREALKKVGDPQIREAGLELLTRIIEDWRLTTWDTSNEQFSILWDELASWDGQEQLGDLRNIMTNTTAPNRQSRSTDGRT